MILYLTAPNEDYLADSLLHGLRTVLGSRVVDFPRCDFLDDTLPQVVRSRMHGRGFTVYGLRPKAEGDAVDRTHIWQRVKAGEFTKVVFSSIWRQYGWFLQHHDLLAPDNTVFVDGEDTPELFPYSRLLLHRPVTATLARLYLSYPYFKRELGPESIRSTWLKLVPSSWTTKTAMPATLKPIAFSIPEQRIVARVPEKNRTLFTHCVDREVVEHFPELTATPPFSDENDYHKGLSESRFAVTTKRSGWDCLRHYEIAANGCVPCFQNLAGKPHTCAPHGLNSSNCIEYANPQELAAVLATMTETEYQDRAAAAIAWARRNSTRERALSFLAQIGYAQDGNVLSAAS